MKKNAPWILSIISCILVVVCLFQIIGLRNELTYLSSNISSDLSHINNNISSIYTTVSDKLEEEANLLSSSEWEYGKIDIDARTAEIIWTIVPKVYNPDVTAAAVFCDGQEFPMVYKNGRYVAVVPAPLFEESLFSHVTLNDDGTIRTQQLDWYITPRNEVLPMIYASYSGGGTGTGKDGKYIWSTTGTIDINIDCYGGEFEIQSVDVVAVLDGLEISRTPVDISEAGQAQYMQTAAEAGEPIPEYLASGTLVYPGNHVSYTYTDSTYFFYLLDETYHIPYGSMLEIYVDVVDGYGLRYRSVADCTAVTKDGELDDRRTDELRMYAYAEPIAIYDKKGTLLYTVDENLFH